MPNYKEHANMGVIVGGIAGMAINFISQTRQTNNNENQKFNLSELLLSGVGGAIIGKIGGVLPDILEPANNPHHRKFFHC